MDVVTTDIKTMAYIKSDGEFERAKLKGFWQVTWSLITGQRPHLLSFNQVVQKFDANQTIDRGVQDISVMGIVGSVDRSGEYSCDFLPSASDPINRDRWRKVYTLAVTGHGFPPVEVFRVGQQYFVVDGHHRVSVARHLGWETVQAHVTELPLVVLANPNTTESYHNRNFWRRFFGSKPADHTNELFNPNMPMLRVLLYKNEVCRLPHAYSEIRVVSGNAWVTVDSRDMFLIRGERVALDSDRDFALISALGKTPLVFEVRSEDSSNISVVRLVPQQAL